MSAARCAVAWNQTSAVMALIANCHRDPKKKREPYEPGDFNPYTPRRAKTENVGEVSSMAELKGLLMGTAANLEESKRQAAEAARAGTVGSPGPTRGS
jgi:hypothetical protein